MREKRSIDELVAASENLNYEFTMLMTIARGLGSGIFSPGTINNALVESFSFHARILLDFLYPNQPRDDDVIAYDYIEEDKWNSLRPKKTELLAGVHNRVGKETAHLTYYRLQITQEEKKWPHIQIANEIGALMRLFIQEVDKNKVSKSWG